MGLFNFQKRNATKQQQIADNVILSALLNDETITEKQALNIPAVARCVKKSIQSAAQKHVKTGSMANSVKSSKPLINRDEDAVGRIKFYGKDKAGVLNWYKAIWIEYYGTSNRKNA